jgi:hypothetical protein
MLALCEAGIALAWLPLLVQFLDTATPMMQSTTSFQSCLLQAVRLVGMAAVELRWRGASSGQVDHIDSGSRSRAGVSEFSATFRIRTGAALETHHGALVSMGE